MNYLSVDGVSKNFGDRQLFKNISFGLEQGQKTALVGVNGSGKSTLMKIIAGLEVPDEGEVTTRNGIVVSYLPQNPIVDDSLNVMDIIFQSDNEILNTIREYEKDLAKAEKNEKNNLSRSMEKMDAMQAWDFEYQIKEILSKLGINNLDKPISDFSGGQQKRVAIAKALIEKPDLIIMDEPTNHLDIQTIEWLEGFLSTQNLSLLLVTHDRYFLDKVTDHIFELSDEKVYTSKGNYAKYLENKALRVEQQEVELDKAKSLMKKELDWMRRQPKARTTKAKFRIDAFEDVKKKATSKVDKSTLNLEISKKRLGKTILEIDNISKSFDGVKVVQPISHIFKSGERLGIIGKNGSGKSTFLNMITGKLTPDQGTIKKGINTEFGYYSQEGLSFKNGQKVIDIVKEIAEVIVMSDGSTATASQFLNHFKFPPKQQYDFVEKLSGGERKRLQLLKVLIKNPNFLILDEPTNDLDIETLNILEDFLTAFGGCLIIVSHDRYFLDKMVDHIFAFEKDKAIKDFPGNYTQYREYLEEEKVKAESTPKPTQNTNSNEKAKPKGSEEKLSYKEKLEFEQLEKDIKKLESEKEDITVKMNKSSIDHNDLIDLSKRVEEIIVELDSKELRWLELSEKS